jgi:hypothetical protein
MRAEDLPAVEKVAEAIHVEHPEEAAVFAERLRLCPDGCLVLEGRQGVAGYLISHPWMLGQPPALDTLLGALPAAADSWYIHDLALAPGARGTGAAGRAVEHAAALGRGLGSLSLISVGRSAGFWRRQGFVTAEAPAGKLASYGAGAAYMVRFLG